MIFTYINHSKNWYLQYFWNLLPFYGFESGRFATSPQLNGELDDKHFFNGPSNNSDNLFTYAFQEFVLFNWGSAWTEQLVGEERISAVKWRQKISCCFAREGGSPNSGSAGSFENRQNNNPSAGILGRPSGKGGSEGRRFPNEKNCMKWWIMRDVRRYTFFLLANTKISKN